MYEYIFLSATSVAYLRRQLLLFPFSALRKILVCSHPETFINDSL